MDEAKSSAGADRAACPPADYEFSPEENVVISGTSSKMRAVAVVAIIWGILDLGVAAALLGATLLATERLPALKGLSGNAPVVTAATTFITGMFKIIFGFLMFPATRSLDAVVQTEGNDISHLMSAMSSLRKAFGAQFVAMVLALGLLCLSVIGGTIVQLLQ